MANKIGGAVDEQQYSQTGQVKCLYDRPYKCPCCGKEFTERTVRMSELSVCGQDSDLRTYYEPIDPIMYDIVLCKKCGYASLAKTFDHLTFSNAQEVAANITPKFKDSVFPAVYTENIALKRYKAAVLSGIIARKKSGELAYLYMRMAWIYRAQNNPGAERRMLLASFEGFLEAIQKESFPIIDLDEETLFYILGDFVWRIGKEEQAKVFYEKLLAKPGFSGGAKKRIEKHPVMQKAAQDE